MKINPVCQGIEQGSVKSDDILRDNIKDINVTSSSLVDNSQSQQQLEFEQGGFRFPCNSSQCFL